MASIFDAVNDREASALLAFAGNRLSRLAEKRPADCLDIAFADPATRALGFIAGRLVVRDPDAAAAALLPVETFEAFQPDRANAVLLGHDGDAACLALPLKADPEALPAGFAALPPRTAYVKSMFADDQMGAIAQGASLVNWTLSAQFCGICGTRTVAEAGGYRRRCPEGEGGCGATLFPRTDPVVIMLAIDEGRDRCLLGRSPHFPPGFYSCLAGFLEPGETMEDAVRRETMEEAGIAVGRVVYHASQPWPVPHSMMVGFYAEAKSFDIDLDGDELEDCRWFTRQEAARLIERIPGEPTTAHDGAIANRLLRDWVARR